MYNSTLPTYLNTLPTECIHEIFTFLPPWDVFKCGQVSRRLQDIAKFFYKRSSLFVELGGCYAIDAVEFEYVDRQVFIDLVRFWALTVRTLKLHFKSHGMRYTVVNFNDRIFITTFSSLRMKYDLFGLVMKCSGTISLSLNVDAIPCNFALKIILREFTSLKELRMIGDASQYSEVLSKNLPRVMDSLEFHEFSSVPDMLQIMRRVETVKEIKIFPDKIKARIIHSLTNRSTHAKELKTLHLYGGSRNPQMSSMAIKSVAKLVNLQELHIQVSGEATRDEVIHHIVSHCTKIRRLKISGDYDATKPTSAAIVSILTFLPDLEELRLAELGLQDLLPRGTVPKALNLHTFSTESCNHVTEDSLLRLVQAAPKLRTLEIASRQIGVNFICNSISSALTRKMNFCFRTTNKKLIVKNGDARGIDDNVYTLWLISPSEESEILDRGYISTIQDFISKHYSESCVVEIQTVDEAVIHDRWKTFVNIKNTFKSIFFP